MTTDAQTLAIREEQALAPRPREVIAGAKEQADALMDIVQARNLFATVGGKPYLEAEAWEIILAFNKVAPDVVYVKPIYEAVMGEDDELVAYEAKVNLIDRSGALRGSGIAECSLDSFPTRGREGRDKDKAAKSAAQTWAISKAARMAFSWVAVLAGFEPTPASEMKTEQAQAATGTDYGTCEKHGVAYFKSANMRSPAHKKHDGGWCNKPKDAQATPAKAPSSPAEPDSEPEGTEQPFSGVAPYPGEPEDEPESDGGPALFPPEQASEPSAKPKITTAAGLWKALGQLGLNKKDHTAAVDGLLGRRGFRPLAEENLQVIYDAVAQEHADRAAHRGQPESTEA